MHRRCKTAAAAGRTIQCSITGWLAKNRSFLLSPFPTHLISSFLHRQSQIFNNMVKERGMLPIHFSHLSPPSSPIFLQLRNADCYTALLQRTVRVQMKYNGGKFSVRRSGDSDSLASALDSASPTTLPTATTTTAAAKWQAFVMSVSVLSSPSVSQSRSLQCFWATISIQGKRFLHFPLFRLLSFFFSCCLFCSFSLPVLFS